jgi:N-acetyl-gamma-glutamylphosphate reductase
VTGYIAGDALYAIYAEHPEYEYAVLVRAKEKGDIVKKAYPEVRIVLGGLDDAKVLEEEAAKADIVLRMFLVSGGTIKADILQMQQTPRITRERQRQLQLDWLKGTRQAALVTGCTQEAQVS